MHKKSQVSVEFLVVIAFVTMTIAVATTLLFNSLSRQNQDLEMAELQKFGNTIVNSINQINYASGYSYMTVDSIFPPNVVNFTIENNKTIVFYYSSINGLTPVVFLSPTNVMLDLTDFSKGRVQLVVRSGDGYTLACVKRHETDCNGICNYSIGERCYTNPSDCCTGNCRCCTNDGRYSSCTPGISINNSCNGFNACKI